MRVIALEQDACVKVHLEILHIRPFLLFGFKFLLAGSRFSTTRNEL